MKIKLKINPYRLVIQIIILGLLAYMLFRLFIDRSYVADFEAYCPFGGIMAFSSFLVNNSLACSMTSVQIAMGLVFVTGIILFSKLFCSFICPVGTVSEWLGKLGEKLKLRITIKGYPDLFLRLLKYLLLFITVYFTISSSELFCRKFDPYYAAMTGFSTDVSLLYGIVAILIVVAGSIFIRLFWCKYLCPVGAISNTFRLLIIFIAVFGIYLILGKLGVKLSFVWPLAAVCELAFLAEVLTLESSPFPLLRIRRHSDICTNCRLCSVNCPQAIDVARMADVKHIDCHLCGDCTQVCPEEGALTINRRGRKWLPALIAIVLIIAGIIIGNTFEIPTLSQYWGQESERDNMALFTKHGLKNVKCFGSSTAFASQVRKVKGVTGVTTFVKTNTVEILYDPALTDTLMILRSIFNPVRVNLTDLKNITGSISEFSMKIENFFDPLDAGYLKLLLQSDTNIRGFTTEFDCPVLVKVFTNSEAGITAATIKNIIESEYVVQKLPDGSTLKIPLRYKVKDLTKNDQPLTPEDYSYRISASDSIK